MTKPQMIEALVAALKDADPDAEVIHWGGSTYVIDGEFDLAKAVDRLSEILGCEGQSV